MAQNPETVIANLILKELPKKFPGIWIHKNVVGRAKLGSGFYSTVGAGVGSADLMVCLKGRLVWLEVKTATGKQSDEQVAFEGVAKASGATYAVVRCLNDAVQVLEEVEYQILGR
jgi:hypothetical protein